ncbi:WbuC family cupin fold metalloprotein [Prevotella sp.]|uniref:WbuC family cupin fold metalloprotein n=1 Tax=Prevotella sp. TaxID=59823 RepID=UPI0030789045
MIIDQQLLDSLTLQAKQYPRLRQAYDLRNSTNAQSQRMLNALEPGTVLPIHRHRKTSVVRGRVRQNMYDDNGVLIESFEASADGFSNFYVTPIGVWHNTECLESGTVIFEAKDGAYEPLRDEDVMKLNRE